MAFDFNTWGTPVEGPVKPEDYYEVLDDTVRTTGGFDFEEWGTPAEPEPPPKTKGQKVLGALDSFGDYATKPAVSIAKLLTSGARKFGTNIGKLLAGKSEEKNIKTLLDQSNDLARRAEKAESYETKSRLLKQATELSEVAGKMAEERRANIPTAKQVAGSAVETAADILAFGTYGGATKGMQAFKMAKPALRGAPSALQAAKKLATKPRTFREGFKAGMKVGAKYGGAFGGAHGVAKGLEENKDTAGVIKSGVGGAASGAATGALVGGTIGGIAGYRAGRKQKELERLVREVQKPVSKKEAVRAIKAAGRPGGAVEEGGLFRKGRIKPTDRDLEIAQEARELVQPGRPVKSSANINRRIGEISDDTVRPYLKKHPRAYNTQQLESHLKKIPKPDLVKTDASLEKTYDLVRKRMIDSAKNRPHTMEGLWDARVDFDDAIQREFGTGFLGAEKDTVVRRAVLDTRQGVNEYINKSIGDKVFTEQMRRMSNLYIAQSNIAEKYAKTFTSAAWRRFSAAHPVLAVAIKFGVPIAAGGYGAKLFGVGQAAADAQALQ